MTKVTIGFDITNLQAFQHALADISYKRERENAEL